MERIIEMLGSMTLSAVIISLPILCTLSFVYSWNGSIQVALTAGTLVEYVTLTFAILKIVGYEDENVN